MNKNYSVIHLSDLHFGRIEEEVLISLKKFILERAPDLRLAVLTGDITQRAKKKEFLAAREFINRLPCAVFLVPGNHDVPLYNPFLRYFSPYKKFLRYLGDFARESYEDDDLAVYGLWTLNKFTVQSGKLNSADVKGVKKSFSRLPSNTLKLIASHHPLYGLKRASELFNSHPHFLLSGHEHQSEIKQLRENETWPVALAAGTSTSNRVKKEANSFNFLTVSEKLVRVEVMVYASDMKDFRPVSEAQFNREHDS